MTWSLRVKQHPSRQMAVAPRRVLIVGGGVASLAAGIGIEERFPHFDVELCSAADDRMLGGQLASWDENGYPIEHGLHSLFDFYTSIIPLLDRIGALGNFARTPKHIFVHERGKIHKFHPRTFFLTYAGFTKSEKMAMRRMVTAAAKIIFGVTSKGYLALDKYDSLDLREYGRMLGVPDSVLNSSFVQQFYDAAFNEPHELSAAVGIHSLYRIFSKPGLLFFNSSSRETIVTPLVAHFEKLGGRIRLNHRLTDLQTTVAGDRVSRLHFTNLATGESVSETADDFVLALGLEDFKALRLGPLEELQYFKNIRKLKTVSSMSIQAWFRTDPVPRHIDTIVNGLPLPFSILGPMTRVRRRPAPGPLPFELMGTGPEAGYGGWSDEDLKRKFFQDLRAVGFEISDDPADHHVVIRRNDASFHRYLLTVPGELGLRPTVQSPLPNLMLAGAWVRNALPLPCVDAATESGLKAAELLADRIAKPAASPSGDLRPAMPRTHPLVLPPPFRFKQVTGSAFLLPSHPQRVRMELPPGLTLFPGFESKLLLSLLHHGHVTADRDLTAAVYAYRECVISVVVRETEVGLMRGLKPRFGLFPLAVYLDNDVAMAAGREAYGFPKKFAAVDIRADSVEIARRGVLPNSRGAIVEPLPILTGHWTVANKRRSPKHELVNAMIAAFGFLAEISADGFAEKLISLPIYNIMAITGSSDSMVTRLPITDVKIERSWRIHDAQFGFGPSATDPIAEYFAVGQERYEGLGLEFEFTLKEADRI